MPEDSRTLLQKIDAVLIYLKNKEKPSYLELDGITPELLRSLNLNKATLLKLLDKLMIDKFVVYDTVFTQRVQSGLVIDLHKYAYMITFEGQIFLESVGGYIKQAALNHSQSTLRDRLDTIQRENTANMVVLTRWIAAGTIVASGYYWIEISKFLYHHVFSVHEWLKFLKIYYI